jgi:hypothetical protein
MKKERKGHCRELTGSEGPSFTKAISIATQRGALVFLKQSCFGNGYATNENVDFPTILPQRHFAVARIYFLITLP